MMRRRLRAALADGGERGFTLIEVLVAATLGLVVLGATLSVLDTFMHQQTSQTRVTNAQDSARWAIDRIEWGLRNASTLGSAPALIERANPYDIVFQTVGSTPPTGGWGSDTTHTVRMRYCVPRDAAGGSASNEVLYQETETWNTAAAPASPWSSDPTVTVPCGVNEGETVPNSTSEVAVVWGVTNRYAQTFDRAVFTYDGSRSSSTPSTVQNVSIDTFVNPTPTNTNAESELTSSVYLRNQGTPPTASFTSTADGSGAVMLNGGTSYSSGGYSLNYAWACTSANCSSSDAGLSASGSDVTYWNPGAGTYTVTLTITDSRGLSSTSTQTVIVT